MYSAKLSSMYLSDKSKPVVMQGRKAMDLDSEIAGLPKRVSEVVFDTRLRLLETGVCVCCT